MIKLLKALFVLNNNNKIPPKTHNLTKLAKISKLKLSAEQILFLDEVNDFNLEVRYPVPLVKESVTTFGFQKLFKWWKIINFAKICIINNLSNSTLPTP